MAADSTLFSAISDEARAWSAARTEIVDRAIAPCARPQPDAASRVEATTTAARRSAASSRSTSASTVARRHVRARAGRATSRPSGAWSARPVRRAPPAECARPRAYALRVRATRIAPVRRPDATPSWPAASSAPRTPSAPRRSAASRSRVSARPRRAERNDGACGPTARSSRGGRACRTVGRSRPASSRSTRRSSRPRP